MLSSVFISNLGTGFLDVTILYDLHLVMLHRLVISLLIKSLPTVHEATKGFNG